MTDLLNFIPEQSGYSTAHPNQVIAVELDGGSPRVRADRLRATGTVSASWVLDRVEYTQFMQFFREKTGRGALPFLADLVTDFFQPARHRCTLVPGSLRTTQVTGLTYRVSADLRPEQLDVFTSQERFETTNQVFFTGIPAFPFDDLFAPGNKVQILGAQLNNGVNPAINLDGIYTVATVPTSSRITLTSPHLINPDWALLASYPGGIAGPVNDVSLIHSPT